MPILNVIVTVVLNAVQDLCSLESNWEECRDMPYGGFVAHAICIGIIQA
jgi:hypothetical protein